MDHHADRGPQRPPLVVLRALGLGDLLTGLPALRALRAAFPGHRLTLLAPAVLGPLAELAGAGVDQLVDVDFRDRVGSLERAGLGSSAGVDRPDVAVNLHGRGPQSHAVLDGLRPRRLIAFADARSHPAGPAWLPGEHEVRRWCRMLEEEGVPADHSALGIDPPAIPPPVGTTGATLLHPGAASPARRWPRERWVALARAERAAGRRVVVTGSPGERELARTVAAGAGLPDASVLAGATSLTELAATVAAADLVVSGDTGVAHLATALSRPSVVLFGPTPPAEWGPPADGRHVALWAGRRGDPHGDEPDPGLLTITVDRVRYAIAQLRGREGA